MPKRQVFQRQGARREPKILILVVECVVRKFLAVVRFNVQKHRQGFIIQGGVAFINDDARDDGDDGSDDGVHVHFRGNFLHGTLHQPFQILEWHE